MMRRFLGGALVSSLLASAGGVRADIRVVPCDEYDTELLESALALELSGDPRAIRIELIPCARDPLSVRVVLPSATETIIVERTQPRLVALAVAERVRPIAPVAAGNAPADTPHRPWVDSRRRATDADHEAWYRSATLLALPRRGFTVLSGQVAGGYGSGAMARGTLGFEHRGEGPWTFAAYGRIWHFSREPSRRDDRYRFSRLRGALRYERDLFTLGVQGGAVFVRGPQRRSLQPLVGFRLGAGPRDLLHFALDVELRLPFGGGFGLSKIGVDLEMRATPGGALVGHIYAGSPTRLGFEVGPKLFLRGEGGPGTVALLVQLAAQLIGITRQCEFGPCGAVEGEDDDAFFASVGAKVGLEIRL